MSSPDAHPPSSSNDQPPLARPVLSYATPHESLGGMAVVARCANAAEAELYANVLDEAGIPSHVLNQNTNALGAPYSGWSEVEVQVRDTDVARAKEILSAAQNPDELEPADDPAAAPATLDDEGRPTEWAVVAAFDHAGAMRDAATTLASANLRVFTPRLVPRGDRPPGEGKRFVLRVLEEDVDRARRVLEAAAENDADGDADDPRCPKCRSWRVYPIGGGVLQAIGKLFGRPGVPEGFECLACGHRGEKAAFLPRRG